MKALYKIVHTSAGQLWQDPEKRILDESLWMQDQGHQVVIIAPPESPLLTRAKAVGLSTYAIPFRGLTLAGQTQQLKEIFENEQPNILNAHGRADGRLSLKAAQKAGVPCRIISRHSSSPLRNSWQNRTLFKKLSHYVFTPSDHTTRHLKKVFKLKDMEIFAIPGGIVPPRSLENRGKARQRLTAGLGLEEQTRFMGLLESCTSRLAESYAVQVLKTLRQIRGEMPHHLLIPEASEEIQMRLQASADRLDLGDRIHFVSGMNRWDYYRALSCGLQTPVDRNLDESIPRAMLEAMYAACPVAACRTTGVMEMISHTESGWLWDSGHPAQAADVLRDILTPTAALKERVHKARELVRQHYTIDTMGRDTIRIYRLHQVKLERRYHQVDPDLDLL